MGDDIRIGLEPPPSPPPRSGKLIGLLAGLVLAVSAAAWLVGTFHDPASPTTTTIDLPAETTSTTAGAGTTAALEDRLQYAREFWTHLGAGEADGAIAAVPEPDPGAADLIAFVAAFSPALTVEECREFTADAVECLVTVTDEDLFAIGMGIAAQRLRLADDGRFGLPALVVSASARLSLHALNFHTEEVQAACPPTGAPQVYGLAIVGSPTAACGAYLAGLIPELRHVPGNATTLP
ncbi:MAG TPA: hypothetical protein VMX37_07520 [Acidimicrobiia bacterium]|nr:hypothetical protein [Acidimicrobiia bacterium]